MSIEPSSNRYPFVFRSDTHDAAPIPPNLDERVAQTASKTFRAGYEPPLTRSRANRPGKRKHVSSETSQESAPLAAIKTPNKKRVLDVALTPVGKSKKRVIYGIVDDQLGKVVYVGKTGQKFERRVAWYKCMAKKVASDSEASVSKQELFNAIAKEPGRFFFTILAEAGPDERLSEVEERTIQQFEGEYNKNRGGGGGSAADSPSRGQPKRKVAVQPDLFTPEKNYPLKRGLAGRVQAAVTPESKKKQNIVYRIRQISTGKIYTGKTEMTFGRRLAGHTYLSNAMRGTEVHRLMQEHPEDFDVGILYECESGVDIDDIEAQFIQHHILLNKAFNKRSGGGGSHASRVV